MRILLTGVSGQVGDALRERLGALGNVIAADRTTLDLSRPRELAAALSAIAPDLIVNPAAYTAVDRAEDEPELAFRINAEAPGVMARWAAMHGVPLIHFSTDYVFDGSGEEPWLEDSPTGPLCVYGASKLAGEREVIAAAGNHLIVRTSWVFAARGRNFLTTMARLARERPELRIVADQVGAPTSARCIATALVGMLADCHGGTPAEGIAILTRKFDRARGIVHVCASGETSWHGFACAIVEGLRSRGVHLEVRNVTAISSGQFPMRAVRPHNSRLDLNLLRRVFGISTPTWQSSLDDELDRLASQ